MAFLTPQTPSSSGIEIDFAEPDMNSSENGEHFRNTGKEILVFTTTGEANLQVTFYTGGKIDRGELSIANKSIEIPDAGTYYFKFDKSVYNTGGYVFIGYSSSDTTGIGVALIKA